MTIRAVAGLLLASLLPALPGCVTALLWSQYHNETIKESVRADVLAVRRIGPAEGTVPETFEIRYARTGANATSPYDWANRIPAEGCVRVETRDRAHADDLAFLVGLVARDDVTVVSATAAFPLTIDSEGVTGEHVDLLFQYRTADGAPRVAACTLRGRCRLLPEAGADAPAPLLAGGAYPFALRFNRSTIRSNVPLLTILTPFTLVVDIGGTILLAWLWWELESMEDDDDFGMRGDAKASGRHGIFAPSLAPSYSRI